MRCFFTIASNNYLASARTLTRSLRSLYPDSPIYIFIADTSLIPLGDEEGVELVLTTSLGIPDHDQMAFRYSIVEFNTSVKPWCFRWLAKTHPESLLYYFDPDIVAYKRLEHIDERLDGGADLVLTPHITSSLYDGRLPDDLTILTSGVYNLGFAALNSASAEVQALLEWWSERLRFDCLIDIPSHRFTDQRWMDLSPAFVRKTAILHHHGYNCAYWNLKHREITRSASGWVVNGIDDLHFYHFSGFSPGRADVLSKHQNRVTLSEHPQLAALFAEYDGFLKRNGWSRFSGEPYGYGNFASGRRVHPGMRRRYLKAELLDEERPFDPFAGDGHWFDEADETTPEITRVMRDVWNMRPDVQRVFPLHDRESLRSYTAWFVDRAGPEEGADTESIGAAKTIALGARSLVAGSDEIEVAPVANAWLAERKAWLNAPYLGPARLARTYFDEVAVIADAHDGAPVPLSRGLLLLLARRPDLQRTFLDNTGLRAKDFVTWLLVTGLRELDGLVSLPRQLFAWLTAGSPQGPSRLASLLSRIGRSEPPSVEFSALTPTDWWTIASTAQVIAIDWPRELREAVFSTRGAYSRTETDTDPPLPWIFDQLIARRPDVANSFDLGSVEGRRALVNWFMIHGSQEMDIGLDAIGAELQLWLDLPAPGRGGVPNALTLLWDRRHDLTLLFPPGNPESCGWLLRWFEVSGLADYDTAALGEWWRRFLLSEAVAPEVGQSAPDVKQQPIYLVGPEGESGRGEDVRMTAAALKAAGVPYEIVAVAGARTLPVFEHGQLVIVHWNADTALIDQERLSRMFPNAYRIGYLAWELARFPLKWGHAFAAYDEVWSSTRFSSDAIAGATEELARFPQMLPHNVGSNAPAGQPTRYSSVAEAERPVIHMPMAVALPEFDREVIRSVFDLPENRFCFLFTFDFKSYCQRKNPAAAVAAFRQAFGDPTERVFLLVKTSNADADPEGWSALKAATQADGRIEVRDRTYSRPELCQLMYLSDCFISPHRSEGFGRGPAEAMLLGKPVIVTAYSGNMDYTTKNNSLLVDFELVPVEPGQYNDYEGQVWADVDVSDLAAAMQQVVADRDSAGRLGRQARADIEARYGVDVVGEQMADRLSYLDGQTKLPSPTALAVRPEEQLRRTPR